MTTFTNSQELAYLLSLDEEMLTEEQEGRIFDLECLLSRNEIFNEDISSEDILGF